MELLIMFLTMALTGIAFILFDHRRLKRDFDSVVESAEGFKRNCESMSKTAKEIAKARDSYELRFNCLCRRLGLHRQTIYSASGDCTEALAPDGDIWEARWVRNELVAPEGKLFKFTCELVDDPAHLPNRVAKVEADTATLKVDSKKIFRQLKAKSAKRRGMR